MKLRHLLLALPLVAGFPIADAVTASAQGVQLVAYLYGGNEVSGAGQAAAGDPDGNGVFSAIIHATQICYGYSVTKIAAPTLAHIHENIAGANGGIVVPLAIPGSGNPGAVSACTPAPVAVLNALRSSPSNFYVNVHNGAFPAGALRGQVQ